MNELIVYLSLITLSLTNIFIFQIEGMNISIFIISIIFIAVITCCNFTMKRSYKFKLFDFSETIVFMFFVSLFYFNSAKFISLLYSIFFFISFQIILNSAVKIEIKQIIKLFEIIIWAYFFNVVIAQLLNLSNIESNILNNIFQYQFDPRIGVIRYYGFSSEPSYAAFIVMISFFVWFSLHKKKIDRYIIITHMSVVYQIIAFKSIYGYMLLMTFYSFFLWEYNFKRTLYFLLILIFTILIAFIGFQEYDSRALKLLVFLINNGVNIDLLNTIDSSTFVRIMPFYQYVKAVDLSDYSFYIGHGPGSSTEFFTSTYWEHVFKEGNKQVLNLGYLPAFLYDYGLLCLYITVRAFKKSCLKNFSMYTVIIFLLVSLNANFNTQLFWFFIISFSIRDFFKNQLRSCN